MTHGEIEIKKYQCPNQHEGTTWYSTVVLISFTYVLTGRVPPVISPEGKM